MTAEGHGPRQHQRDDDEQPERDGDEDFKPVGPVRTAEIGAGDDLLGRLGVDRDAGHQPAQGRGADIEQADGRGADEDDVAFQQGADVRVLVRIEQVADGDVALGLFGRVVDPQFAVGGGRDGEVADAQRRDRRPAGVGLAAGAGGAHEEAARDLSQPQRLDDKARIERLAAREDQRNAAYHAAGIGA